ncbi:MAG: hypothetical protein KGK06_00270, partial [Xanthomonadaceae bacterium]|nr:hypothetical protein [Xanthomonadaceae bacterium]
GRKVRTVVIRDRTRSLVAIIPIAESRRRPPLPHREFHGDRLGHDIKRAAIRGRTSGNTAIVLIAESNGQPSVAALLNLV